MSRPLQVVWQETATEFQQQHQQEKHVERRERLLALWHLRQGHPIPTVAAWLNRSPRQLQRWVAWYRLGGLSEVLRRVTGYATTGVPAYLTPLQQKALVARVKLGDFRTVWDCLAWVEARWGIVYSYEGLRCLLHRLGCTLQVPRPQAAPADPAQQEQWQKKA